VLRDIPKPLAELHIPKEGEVKVASCNPAIIPQTPVTPVSAEALGSLQDLIIKQDAYTLNKTSKQSLKQHLQKFAKATRVSFAKVVLKDEQIQFLMTINNKAKVR
jgi:hypothetical protein